MKVLVTLLVLLCVWQQAAAYNCYSYEFNCGNGQCVLDDDECDGYDDCSNGADEDDCTYTVNVGLVVGLTITAVVLFIVIPVAVIVTICCCCVGICATATAPRSTHVVTHTAPAGPQVTVVSANSSNMTQAVPPSIAPNPYAYQPAPGYKV